jgi:hypothetical protein
MPKVGVPMQTGSKETRPFPSGPPGDWPREVSRRLFLAELPAATWLILLRPGRSADRLVRLQRRAAHRGTRNELLERGTATMREMSREKFSVVPFAGEGDAPLGKV